MTVDEESPLLSNHLAASEPAVASDGVRKEKLHLFGKTSIAAALLGVFIAHADEMLVLTTYETIASQFQDLSNGPWLLTGYTLGYCVALPVVSSLTFSTCSMGMWWVDAPGLHRLVDKPVGPCRVCGISLTRIIR